MFFQNDVSYIDSSRGPGARPRRKNVHHRWPRPRLRHRRFGCLRRHLLYNHAVLAVGNDLRGVASGEAL